MKKEVLIFDFDGVIVDSFPACLAVNQMFDPTQTAEEYKLMFTGNIYDALAKRDAKAIATPPPNLDFFTEYSKRVLPIPPVAGIQAVIKTAQQKGWRLFILSSTDNKPIQDYLTKYGLDGYFEGIYGSDVERSKVKKFQMIIERCQVTPKEMLFITDTLGDLVEAHKLSIESIAVTYGFHDRSFLKKAPTPVPIIDTPAELQSLLTTIE